MAVNNSAPCLAKPVQIQVKPGIASSSESEHPLDNMIRRKHITWSIWQFLPFGNRIDWDKVQILVTLTYEDTFSSDSRNNVASHKTEVLALAQWANLEYYTSWSKFLFPFELPIWATMVPFFISPEVAKKCLFFLDWSVTLYYFM